MAEDKKTDEVQPGDLASLWGESPGGESPKPASSLPKEKIETAKQAETVVEGEVVEESAPAQTETKKPAPPPESPPAPSEEFSLEEDESLGDRLNSILEELNISGKHVAGGIGCLVLIIGLIVGGAWFFTESEKSPKLAKKTSEGQEVAIEQGRAGVTGALSFGKSSFLPASFFGGRDIILSLITGTSREARGQFAQYVFLLKRMQSAYSTDVNALLNGSTDRRAALNNHIARMKNLAVEATSAFQEIKDELARYQPLLDEGTRQQQDSEKGFFEQLNVLNPQAEDLLNGFIEKAKNVTAVKARVRSLQQLEKFYNQALPKLTARIRDLELNEEALVAGIKVYDIRGSDLQLIIFEEGARDSSERKLFPLLDVGPGAGQDFITRPNTGTNPPKK